jgi:putative ABC transport system substrate-binding protein
VDLIVARSTVAIVPAMAATRTIPIVMLHGNFPVENGLVQSLARPGGNVTGTAYVSGETAEKLLQLLKEIAPKTVRVTGLGARPSDPRSLKVWTAVNEGLLRAADRLGMSFQGFDVGGGSLEEVMGALEGMAKNRSEFMVYWGEPRYRTHRAAIVDFLRRRRIPSISIIPGYVEAGGLAQYSPDVLAIIDRTAGYVDRILQGARAADLPVELPAKYAFAVNLKTAKEIGVAIPQSILLRADRVIE